MVYVNSKKFACESCIKGHRSSSCHHTDRPLFEIKKKGRPISQCQKCRDLRKSKRVHSKCTCNDKDDGMAPAGPSKVPTGTKSKRFIPIVPALPNGLQDVLKASRISSSLPADARQRVESLLNPCHCRSVWKCNCGANDPEPSSHEKGLDALARAAAMFESSEAALSTTSPPTSSLKAVKHLTSRPTSPNRHASRDGKAFHKRTKHARTPSLSPGPDLAPIFLDGTDGIAASSTAGPALAIPNFETMPPMSMITSLAGSGCTCGLQCACPGCVEHRGPEHASKERKNCADGCGTCVDHAAGIAMPGTSSSAPNILDRFFARAAALPAPPTNRRMGGVDLDPMNITVYPDAAFSASDRAVAFGLVTIPKLECCGGRCACPAGQCGCGQSCNGCCQDHSNSQRQKSASPVAMHLPSTPAPPVRSCCAGKNAAAIGA